MMGTASLGRTAALAAAAYGASMQAGQHAGSPGHAPQWDGAPLLGQAQAQAQAGLEEEMNEDAAEDVENLLESYFAQVGAQLPVGAQQEQKSPAGEVRREGPEGGGVGGDLRQGQIVRPGAAVQECTASPPALPQLSILSAARTAPPSTHHRALFHIALCMTSWPSFHCPTVSCHVLAACRLTATTTSCAMWVSTSRTRRSTST